MPRHWRATRNIAFVVAGFCALSSGNTYAGNERLRENVQLAKQSVYRLKFADGRYTGSGFKINAYGGMLTCAHVVDSSTERSGKYVQELIAQNYLTITVDSNTSFQTVVTFKATVDTVIPTLDLAVLTADLQNPSYRGFDTLHTPLARTIFLGFWNSDSLWEGQDVFACAYIKDKFATPRPIVARGVISTIRTDCYDASMENEVDIIQLDMNISRGNSGAPVFLPDNGRVVGVIDWGFFRDSTWQTGYAVAISTNQIVAKLRELKIPLDFK